MFASKVDPLLIRVLLCEQSSEVGNNSGREMAPIT